MHSTSRPLAAVALLLVAFVVLAAWYSVRLPVGEGVDEGAHFQYVRYVKEQRTLPTFPRESAPPVAMAHHPPLYYVLGALVIAPYDTTDADRVLLPNPHFVWRENDGSNGWNVVLHHGQDAFPWRGTAAAVHALRALSVALGAVTVWACYKTARLLLPGRRWAPLGAAALVAFDPSFVYASSTIHHDPLIICLSNLVILWATRIALGGPTRRRVVTGGLLVGAAALTKATGLVLLPVLALSVLLARRERWGRPRPAGAALGLVAVAGAASGWWFVRNQVLYGDPLGWGVFREVFWFNFRRTPYSWGLFRHEFLAQLGRTFWGGFGFMHMTFPDVSRYVWYATACAGAGLAVSIVAAVRRGRWRDVARRWAVPVAALALVLAAVVGFSVQSTGAGHARYVFPAAGAYAALLIVGYEGLAGWRAERPVAAVVAVAMLAYAVWLPATRVWPRYAPPPEADEGDLAAAVAVALDFDGGIRLAAYTVEPGVAVPGAWMTLTTYWQATGDPAARADPFIHAALVADDGTPLDGRSFWPCPATSPVVWERGQTYASRTSLHYPPTGEARSVRIEVTLTDGREGPPLAARADAVVGPTERGAATIAVLPAAQRLVAARREEIRQPRSEHIGDAIGLAGYDVAPKAAAPGDVVVVTLFWEVLARPSADLTTFVHLLDDAGGLAAQLDSPPGGGSSPTSTWTPGELWMDSYPVLLPADLPAGRYRVLAGMYTWPDLVGQRVSLDGDDVGDSVVLGEIVVP